MVKKQSLDFGIDDLCHGLVYFDFIVHACILGRQETLIALHKKLSVAC